MRPPVLGSAPALLAIAFALSACGQNPAGNIAGTPPGGGAGGDGTEGSPLMAPGQNCMQCHAFTAAGTVFTSSGAGASGVTVEVGGVTLTTNAAGNFFTTQPITFPATIVLQNGAMSVQMPTQAPSGACASCHGVSQPTIVMP